MEAFPWKGWFLYIPKNFLPDSRQTISTTFQFYNTSKGLFELGKQGLSNDVPFCLFDGFKLATIIEIYWKYAFPPIS